MDIPVRHLPHDGQECPSYIVPGNLCAGAYSYSYSYSVQRYSHSTDAGSRTQPTC